MAAAVLGRLERLWRCLAEEPDSTPAKYQLIRAGKWGSVGEMKAFQHEKGGGGRDEGREWGPQMRGGGKKDGRKEHFLLFSIIPLCEAHSFLSLCSCSVLPPSSLSHSPASLSPILLSSASLSLTLSPLNLPVCNFPAKKKTASTLAASPTLPAFPLNLITVMIVKNIVSKVSGGLLIAFLALLNALGVV